MTRARRDVNRVPTLIGVASTDGETPTLLEVDPSTGELLVKSTGTTSLLEFKCNNIDENTDTLTYFGYEKADGTWYILEMDETANPATLTYATATNNATYTTYADAWADRVSLTYEIYSEAF